MKSLRSIKDVSKCTETLPDPPDPTRRYVKSCEEDVCGCILSRRSVKKNSKFTESATGGGSINNYKPLTLLGHLWPAPHARPRSPRSQRRWGQRDGSSAGGPVMENHMDLHHKSGWRLAKPNFFHWGKEGIQTSSMAGVLPLEMGINWRIIKEKRVSQPSTMAS